MNLNWILAGLLLPFSLVQGVSVSLHGKPGNVIRASQPKLLQNLVTWDEHSIFVRGQRILFYSGEFHPFRLPVPSLWLDVFQKIKALGYNGVSFYTDWALLEGDPGTFTAQGVFDLDPFFDAASQAGIYLLARPGPYINAEVSGGGFPGWLQRIPGILRTNATSFEDAAKLYMHSIGQIIAKAQITHGGPVILLQPENEYTFPYGNITFPNYNYFGWIEQQYRGAGVVLPFISNDAAPTGILVPGNASVSVNIYGHDSYPLGFDCAHPYMWPDAALPTNYHTLHLLESPHTPYSIVEFQGGSFDPWGGSGFEKCTTLLNEEFERVFYKNDFSFGVTVFNIYMTYGGTNWGNLGHPGGYTSYDYGAVIKEDRTVAREKYSQAKLLANFITASPAYLTATPGNAGNGSYVTTAAIDVTPLFGNGSATNFYVVRHSAYNSLQSTQYKIKLSTSQGNITVPQLGGSLTLSGRDAKVHVTDYNLAGMTILYSTAEIFTWQNYSSGTVAVLYGGAGETHEFAFSTSLGSPSISGGQVHVKAMGGAHIFQWNVSPSRQVVTFNKSGLTLYLLWRNDVYNWWTLELPAAAPTGNFTSPSKTKMIVSGGYLMRSASIKGSQVALTGDVNATTTIEIIAGAPSPCSAVLFNNKSYSVKQAANGTVSFTVPYAPPNVNILSLQSLQWKSIDSLPEISPHYDDSLWTVCNHTSSNNPLKLSTPTSLYASDYGYNCGSLIYRGHFTATSSNSSAPILNLKTQGGYAFGHSAWLNSSFLGSYAGVSTAQNTTVGYPLENLSAGSNYVITVVIDHMGLDENPNPGLDSMKNPRGILSYNLTGYPQSAISWKLTGNLGGEQYRDKTRGPLNEGGMYAERQGYHLPNPPTSSAGWNAGGSPLDATDGPGITFYTAPFTLDLPSPEYDLPLSVVFTNSTSLAAYGSDSNEGPAFGPGQFRCQLYINGYQFGKYVNHVGPQTEFPVPEGILNYHGQNWIALTVWAMEVAGARLRGLNLVPSSPAVLTGRGPVALSPMPGWSQRSGAY